MEYIYNSIFCPTWVIILYRLDKTEACSGVELGIMREAPMRIRIVKIIAGVVIP